MSPKRKFAILVVDDDPKIRELVQAYFSVRNEEVTCVVAADAQQALMKLSNQEFDLLIVDNVMPMKSGIDLALHVKKSAKYSHVAIVLMSGALRQEDLFKAVEGGIKEVLVKPFTLKQLGEKIAPHLARYNQK